MNLKLKLTAVGGATRAVEVVPWYRFFKRREFFLPSSPTVLLDRLGLSNATVNVSTEDNGGAALRDANDEYAWRFNFKLYTCANGECYLCKEDLLEAFGELPRTIYVRKA